MIDFQPFDLSCREDYVNYLQTAAHRGCAYAFANLNIWGRQRAAFVGDMLVLFSHYDGATMYPFPAGCGDVKAAVDAIIADAGERGIPCRISGVTLSEREMLEQWYPGQFCFHTRRDSADYVYDIHDLAELKGRRYQQKRNHVNRFTAENPDAYVKPLSAGTLPDAMAVAEKWYADKLLREPEADVQMERAALNRAFTHWQELGMEGLVLYAGDKPIAMTMGSFLAEDTVDVHFEKADAGITGSYAVINRAFARYLREKYPAVKYLNREEDMGDPGLRKAKESYHPHHMVEKYWAHLLTEEYHDY